MSDRDGVGTASVWLLVDALARFSGDPIREAGDSEPLDLLKTEGDGEAEGEGVRGDDSLTVSLNASGN